MELKRNISQSLCAQLAAILRQEICSGVIGCGERLDGERSLSERYQVSRGTVIEALDLLEREGYVRRIPSKGRFVQDMRECEAYHRILLPFPEARLDLASLHNDLEVWQISDSVRNGLLFESQYHRSEVVFRHVADGCADCYLPQHDRFSGAVFIGSQLGKLSRQLVSEGMSCVRISSEFQPFYGSGEHLIAPDCGYNMSILLQHIADHGYRRLLVITEDSDDQQVSRHFTTKLAEVERHGELFEQVEVIRSNGVLGELCEMLHGALEQGSDGVAVLCLYTVMVPGVHQFIQEYNRIHGGAVGMAGYGTGACFVNLVPELTYLKVDYQAMGQLAVRHLFQGGGQDASQVQLVHGELIQGQSI